MAAPRRRAQGSPLGDSGTHQLCTTDSLVLVPPLVNPPAIILHIFGRGVQEEGGGCYCHMALIVALITDEHFKSRLQILVSTCAVEVFAD